ncbi:MAG: hypothetical protein U0790_09275 [Isosphaeraceae bacterium]
MRFNLRSRLALVVLVGVAVMASSRPAHAQLNSSEEERLQILSDPDALKKTAEKDKSRAPFEFFRSQVTPFDVLPMVKPHQWSTVILEVRSNLGDYEGVLQSLPVKLEGMPQEMIYAREARLVKEQRSRLAVQMLIPRVPREKELPVELLQPGAIRFDEVWQVPIRLLPPHQMLVVVLSKESSSQYVGWSRLPALVPGGTDREDPMSLDLQRYYRLVLPEEPDKPFLSPHPLTWAPISHILWDGLPPDTLLVAHQQAMLDWLHWGGQIVIMGGAGPTFSIFRDSFLGPYLPGEPTGESKSVGDAELRPLAETYPPPARLHSVGEQEQPVAPPRFDVEALGGRPYRPPVPIRTLPSRPLIVAGVKPLPGSSTIPLGEGSPHLLAVERRVGRGRVTMLTINPNDPSLTAWPGLDTLIRRVVLRRPEEAPPRAMELDPSGNPQPPGPALEAPDLTWYRITSRDAKGLTVASRPRPQPERGPPTPAGGRYQPKTAPSATPAAGGGTFTSEAEDAVSRRVGVAEWRDTSALPRLSRELLEKASGITVPGKPFVLKVILAYMIAVVPLNWLLCRGLFRRREWAWLIVPLLALGFAVGVERVAAYDMGYDSACDEIDLLEVQAGYPRAHLTRFASLYTTGRARYSISFPDDPTALALPFDNERSIGGEEVTTAVWQSYPVAALRSMAVQPRSLSMFRAEQIVGLSGTIRLEDGEGRRTIRNDSDLELRDAVLVDYPAPGRRNERALGTIPPGGSVDLGEEPASPAALPAPGFDGPAPGPFLEELRKNREERPENEGELRLVAWVPRPVVGQTFEPALDRHRGMTAVLVHLRYGNPPSPDGPRYNLLAAPSGRAERPAADGTATAVMPSSTAMPEFMDPGVRAQLLAPGPAVAAPRSKGRGPR